MTPFIKWAGGKRQLLNALIKMMPKEYNNYFEPFVGGGALLFAIKPQNAIINDINKDLQNVYKQIKENVEKVINKLKIYDSKSCTKERYYELRDKFNIYKKNEIYNADSAALFIWINKHCFNGIYRENSKGYFNVPYNNKSNIKSYDIVNLLQISEYLNKSKIEILSVDFGKICNRIKKNDFVYFDPPYMPLNSTSQISKYTKEGFGIKDQYRLAAIFDKLSKKGVKALISNYDVPLIRKLFKGYKFKSVKVKRYVNRNGNDRQWKEILISNF